MKAAYSLLVLLLALAAAPAHADLVPRARVQAYVDQLLVEAKDIAKMKPENKTGAYCRLMDHSVDTFALAKFVAGRGWRLADQTTQTSFAKAFKAITARYFKFNFENYLDSKFVFAREYDQGESNFSVIYKVTIPKGQTVNLELWFKVNDNDQLLLRDMAIQGISYSVTKRNEYSRYSTDLGDLTQKINHLVGTDTCPNNSANVAQANEQ